MKRRGGFRPRLMQLDAAQRARLLAAEEARRRAMAREAAQRIFRAVDAALALPLPKRQAWWPELGPCNSWEREIAKRRVAEVTTWECDIGSRWR